MIAFLLGLELLGISTPDSASIMHNVPSSAVVPLYFLPVKLDENSISLSGALRHHKRVVHRLIVLSARLLLRECVIEVSDKLGVDRDVRLRDKARKGRDKDCRKNSNYCYYYNKLYDRKAFPVFIHISILRYGIIFEAISPFCPFRTFFAQKSAQKQPFPVQTKKEGSLLPAVSNYTCREYVKG